MAKLTDLVKYLQRNYIPFEVIEHEPTFSAHQTAVITRVPEGEIAKAVVVSVDGRFWMTVTRADQRLHEQQLKHALGAKSVHLAHEEDLTALFPDCQLGAMPPFGNLYGLPVVVDESLAKDEMIVFNACTHSKAIKMAFKDFKRLVHPVIAEFAASPDVERQLKL